MLLALCNGISFNRMKSETDASALSHNRCPRVPQKCDGCGTALYVLCRFALYADSTNIGLVAWVYVLLLIACVQVAVLGLQTSFGPAFFLPQRVRYFNLFRSPLNVYADGFWQLADSQGYDYHPPLPDTEGGPLGDCAICMDAIDRPPEDASGKPGRRGARTRASYSLAPCAHLFVRFFFWFNRFIM
jgi:hypothetical protein